MQKKPQQPTPDNKIEREPLQWLFTAEFKDSSFIHQTQEDKCLTRTDGTGSTFTDVLARDDLVAFHLYHIDNKQAATVDLQTGAFVINNTPFNAHDQNFDPSRYRLKLIYFRETKIDNDIKATVQADMSIKEEVVKQRHYVNRYFIGWQTTVAGKNKQVIIAVG